MSTWSRRCCAATCRKRASSTRPDLAEYEKLLKKKRAAREAFVKQTLHLGVAYERAFLDWLDRLPWIDDGPSRVRR